MSRFTGPIDVRQQTTDWRTWQLLDALAYEAGAKGSGRWIIAPAGSVTDGASVPRPLWWLLPSTGRYFRAAVIHDRLYELLRAGRPHINATTRAGADRELRLAARACGCSAVVAWVLWAGVRLGGWRFMIGAAAPTGLTVDTIPDVLPASEA
jgi:hypothetical protein